MTRSKSPLLKLPRRPSRLVNPSRRNLHSCEGELWFDYLFSGAVAMPLLHKVQLSPPEPVMNHPDGLFINSRLKEKLMRLLWECDWSNG